MGMYWEGVSSCMLFSKDRNNLKLDTTNSNNAKKWKVCRFSKSDDSDMLYFIGLSEEGESRISSIAF